jgi:hypothetical protein
LSFFSYGIRHSPFPVIVPVDDLDCCEIFGEARFDHRMALVLFDASSHGINSRSGISAALDVSFDLDSRLAAPRLARDQIHGDQIVTVRFLRIVVEFLRLPHPSDCENRPAFCSIWRFCDLDDRRSKNANGRPVDVASAIAKGKTRNREAKPVGPYDGVFAASRLVGVEGVDPIFRGSDNYQIRGRRFSPGHADG